MFICFIQGHSEIYQCTLDIVSRCPSPGEYKQKSIAKCAHVCGSNMQDENCGYHCMRDSSKTKLVEFCAKPEILFCKIWSSPFPPLPKLHCSYPLPSHILKTKHWILIPNYVFVQMMHCNLVFFIYCKSRLLPRVWFGGSNNTKGLGYAV